MPIIGWILIILGILFIVLSLAAAARELLSAPQARGLTNLNAQGFTGLIKVITALLGQLFEGPKWFLTFAIGVVLIYLGARLQANQPLLPFVS